MNSFTGTLQADAVVSGCAAEVYDVLVEPSFIERSTPFIRRVVDLGDGLWRWEVAGIGYPGGSFTASFTEQMGFEAPHLITFAHAPRGRELAGADGAFRIRETGDVTVALALEVHVTARVPAPRMAAPVVEAAMSAVLVVMRERFVRNLERALREQRSRG